MLSFSSMRAGPAHSIMDLGSKVRQTLRSGVTSNEAWGEEMSAVREFGVLNRLAEIQFQL